MKPVTSLPTSSLFTGVLIATAFAFSPASARDAALLAEPRLSFSSDDFQLGGRLGGEAAWNGVPVAVFAEFEIRPYGRTVTLPVTPTLSHQLKETRNVFGLGTTASYPLLSHLHAVGGAGLGYTFADYSGSSRAPETGWTGWLEAGPRLVFSKSFWLGAAYQWRPLPEISPHRVTVGLGLRLSR